MYTKEAFEFMTSANES